MSTDEDFYQEEELNILDEFLSGSGCGYLVSFTGTMFSGKTTKLINMTKKAALSYGVKVLIILPAKKDGSSRHERWHSLPSSENITISHVESLEYLVGVNFDVIIIDDILLITHTKKPAATLDIIERWLTDTHQRKLVCIAWPSCDWSGHAFSQWSELLANSDHVIFTRAGFCNSCDKKAVYSMKNEGAGTGVITGGGTDKYHLACRMCRWKQMHKLPAGSDWAASQ